ncbi:hypothetical protein BGZ73_007928, partial [Actinomortierella ambigua]
MTEFFLLTGGRGAWNQGSRDRRTNTVEHPYQHRPSSSPTATTPTIEISMMEAGLAWPTTGPSSPSFSNMPAATPGPTSPPMHGFEQPLPNGWWGQQQQPQLPMRHHPHMAPQQSMRTPPVEECTTCCINVWDLRTGQRLYSLIPRLSIQPDPAMSAEETFVQALQKRTRKSTKSQGNVMEGGYATRDNKDSAGKGKKVQHPPCEDEKNETTQQGKTKKPLIRTASYSPNISSTDTLEQHPQQGSAMNGPSRAVRQRGIYPQCSSASPLSLSPPTYSSSTTWSTTSLSTSLPTSAASVYSTPGYGSNPRPSSVTNIVIPGPGAGSGDGRFASPSISLSPSFSSSTNGGLSHHHARPLPNSPTPTSSSSSSRSPRTGMQRREDEKGPACASISASPKTPTSPISRPLTLVDMTVTPDHSTLIVALCERWGQGREGVYAWDFSGTRLEGYHDDGEVEDASDDSEDDEERDWRDEGDGFDGEDERLPARDETEGERRKEEDSCGGGDKVCSTQEQGEEGSNNDSLPLSTMTATTTAANGCAVAKTQPAITRSKQRLLGAKDLYLRRNDVIMQQVSPRALAAFHQARITGKVW